MAPVIVVLGDAKIGKSTLCHAFVLSASGQLREQSAGGRPDFDGIIFDEQTVDFQGIKVVIRNTSGKETLDTMRAAAFKDAGVVLLCFAANNAKSLDAIKQKWQPEAKRLAPQARLLLVCTLSDLQSKKKRRMSMMSAPLPELEGKAWAMAKSLGCTAVVSVSGKMGDKVDEVFKAMVKLASESSAAASSSSSGPSTATWFAWMSERLWGPNREELSRHLHKASSTGDLEITKQMLSKGAHASWRPDASADPLRQSPLHMAVLGGHYDVALALVNAGANLEAADAHGNTPLHLASRQGMHDIAKVLLSRGAAVNARNMLQNTPLHEACGPSARSKPLAVMLIKEYKANTKCRNLKGQTALECAAASGNQYFFMDDEGEA